MDEDWIEEELLVYVDYGKYVPAGEITDPDLQFKIIGLEGGNSTIYSEVNGKVFSGEYHAKYMAFIALTSLTILLGTYVDAIGTNMFFVEDPNPPKTDNIFERTTEKSFSLQATTSKVIQMNRIFIEPRSNETAEIAAEEVQGPSVRRKFTVEQTYQEALDKLLKPGHLPPRTVTDALDNKIMLQRELEMELTDNE